MIKFNLLSCHKFNSVILQYYIPHTTIRVLLYGDLEEIFYNKSYSFATFGYLCVVDLNTDFEIVCESD